jgi:hypothetical protein
MQLFNFSMNFNNPNKLDITSYNKETKKAMIIKTIALDI